MLVFTRKPIFKALPALAARGYSFANALGWISESTKVKVRATNVYVQLICT